MIERRQSSGFTLIELMVVIAIIAVVSALMVSVSGRTYGANARNFADQLTQTMSLAKQRAVSTRKWQRVEITGSAPASPAVATTVTLWQWSNIGMTTPAGTCTVGPPAINCWQVVQQNTIPTGVSVWEGSTTIDVSGGLTKTENTALDFNVDFKPDGSSTGGTAFINDSSGSKMYRVLVYRATGSSYARADW
ncbi:hypothetical protein BH11MYX3_BH11MYX3_03160 [soil metagenome]